MLSFKEVGESIASNVEGVFEEAGDLSLMAVRISRAELPPLKRFSSSGSRRGGVGGERDLLAQRLLESCSIESEGASESWLVLGAADVVGWGRSALFLAELAKALCAGPFLAAL